MKKIFFNGMHFGQGGPVEVNKNIVKCLKGRVIVPTCRNTYFRYIQNYINIFRSDIVIFSGMFFHLSEIYLAKILRRKIIFIMHGCCHLELGYHNKIEDTVLRLSNLILCVSEHYMELMKNEYPQFAYKMEYLTNGIDWGEIKVLKDKLSNKLIRNDKRIILFGGGRVIKGNLFVCKAVQEINEEDGTNYFVDVYGYYRDNDDSKQISLIPCVKFNPVISREKVNIELMKSHIFIQNSFVESFGLALIDALQCGCDVLYSMNVGSKDIINSKDDMDIIYNSKDITEIKTKIRNLIKKSNNERLVLSIDKYSSSIEMAAEKLLKKCSRYE